MRMITHNRYLLVLSDEFDENIPARFGRDGSEGGHVVHKCRLQRFLTRFLQH